MKTAKIILNGGSAAVEVRESQGMDYLDSTVAYSMLAYDRASRRERGRAVGFVDALLRSTVSGDLGVGVDWPTQDQWDVVGTDLQPVFDSWQRLPSGDFVAWYNALKRVNEPAQPQKSVQAKKGRK